ncbi:cytoplasmic tRNA 2-thiolation protein 2-like [Hydractinia symbiolongicarpus]|uniref:cytoplasmic tRNA 2-thiolation protein 2-like n=1 Tax=Hydractinia symbiolongicarpus TaxID=13093 RepID=UPI00254D2390|nr:cytoplasmic tRNA 2-thiolation protein 2-like [Hydractinia symbiolongicarpus]XP_057311744.1 cytoplasmic tRNA 2-thiolation protein 2-like [Hydractinia symbiolongicarpus]
MCDVNEDKLNAEQMLQKKKKVLVGSTCMKCKENKAIVVIRVNDPMCRSCFLVYVTHKFRSTLGKARLIKPNDKVLLALSSGHSSMAMLHLVNEALSESAHKRLKFEPGVVFIDERDVLSDNKSYDFAALKDVTEKLGYPFYTVPIHKRFQADADEGEVNSKKRFCECFNSINTLSAKIEFLSATRMSLIVDTARKYNFTKIMFGETATTLTMKLLCNVAQGRGANIAQDMGVSDNRHSNITLIRPMREFSSKEVAIYNRLHEIEVNPLPNLHTMTTSGSSLHRQTEEFITGLQADFPSTVNTVFRTSDKLCVNADLKVSDKKCLLCQSVLLMEEEEREKIVASQGHCCGSSDECNSGKLRLKAEDVRSLLCYGCKLTFKDMGNRVELLPEKLLQDVSVEMKRSKMKESIQDFLLE